MEKTFKKDSLVSDSGCELIRASVESVDFKNSTLFLDNNETLKYQKLIIATGATPVTGLFKNKNLETGPQGIIVNNKMETNIKNVYALGDCTQFTSGITKQVISGKLATNAVPMAKVLARNLLGENRIYTGFFNGAATKIGKYYAGGTGLTEKSAAQYGYETVTGYSQVTSKFPIMPGAEKIKLKLIADKKSMLLIGAQIIAKEPVTDKVDLLTFAIQKKTTISELTELSYSSQPWQSFFPAGNLIVLAAEDILARL
jgi:NADPH-dependent 2,4-dienoyl-CoA reductase/sulfur reductase-like enzyme